MTLSAEKSTMADFPISTISSLLSPAKGWVEHHLLTAFNG